MKIRIQKQLGAVSLTTAVEPLSKKPHPSGVFSCGCTCATIFLSLSVCVHLFDKIRNLFQKIIILKLCGEISGIFAKFIRGLEVFFFHNHLNEFYIWALSFQKNVEIDQLNVSS